MWPRPIYLQVQRGERSRVHLWVLRRREDRRESVRFRVRSIPAQTREDLAESKKVCPRRVRICREGLAPLVDLSPLLPRPLATLVEKRCPGLAALANGIVRCWKLCKRHLPPRYH